MEPILEGNEELLKLQQTLKELTKKYPDRAGELLREDANKFRKDIAAEFKDKSEKTK